MAQPRRIKRLQSLIQEVIAETLHQEVSDPRMGMVTVTRIELAPDLTRAKVFWSCLETGGARRTVEAAMESALGLFQRRVAETISTRVTPVLSLQFDETLENAQRLDEIFHKLREERDEDKDSDEDSDEASDGKQDDADVS